MKRCLRWGHIVVRLFIAFLEERECVEKLGRMSPPFLFSMKTMQRNIALVLPSQQRLHKLCFLQKLGSQKPCWDQARLSSLVDKQVGPTLTVPLSYTGLINLQFIQKLSRQEPCWDQARLSSLVNEQVWQSNS